MYRVTLPSPQAPTQGLSPAAAARRQSPRGLRSLGRSPKGFCSPHICVVASAPALSSAVMVAGSLSDRTAQCRDDVGIVGEHDRCVQGSPAILVPGIHRCSSVHQGCDDAGIGCCTSGEANPHLPSHSAGVCASFSSLAPYLSTCRFASSRRIRQFIRE